jgi:NDP-sugar pyrophosphorylase family protein
MHAIILVGGRGERLRPATDTTVKPMLEVGGKPILEYQINQLRKAGITDIILAENYRAEDIQNYFGNGEKFGVKIKHHLIPELSFGTAGALKAAISDIPPEEEDFAVLWGDIMSAVNFEDLVARHRETKPLITMMTIKSNLAHGIVRKTADGKLAGFEQFPSEGLNPNGLINGAIFIMSRKIQSFLPYEGNFSKDVLEKIVGQQPVTEYVFDGYWRHISTEKDLLIARAESAEGRPDHELSPLPTTEVSRS